MTRHGVPWAIQHLWWVQDLHTLYFYPSAVAPPGLKHSTHPVSIWRSAAQPECQGQTGLVWLPRNLWTNVTTSVLTTYSKCLLNKDVVPYTLSKGAKKKSSDVICDGTANWWEIFLLVVGWDRYFRNSQYLKDIFLNIWPFVLLYFLLNVLLLSDKLAESVSFSIQYEIVEHIL